MYLSAVFSISLVLPYTDPALPNLYDPRPTTGNLSPFVIAIKAAGFDVLPGIVSVAILFASWSTTNTTLFVASRTLYGMAVKLEPENYPTLSLLRRTTHGGVPLAAILASCVFTPLVYLQCGGSDPQKLLAVFSQVETVACLIVWFCQCLAFIRFYDGWAPRPRATRAPRLTRAGCRSTARATTAAAPTTRTAPSASPRSRTWASPAAAA